MGHYEQSMGEDSVLGCLLETGKGMARYRVSNQVGSGTNVSAPDKRQTVGWGLTPPYWFDAVADHIFDLAMESSDAQTHHPELPALAPIGGGHHRCVECGRVIYSDPKVAVAAIIPLDGGIVLLKRAIEPQMGKWSFPSGYVDRGEKLERALEREVMEECGLEVRVEWLVGVYSGDGEAVVLVVYHADVVSGELSAGDETADARVFAVDGMPELAFEHDDRIVGDWQAGLELRGADA